MKLKTYIQDFLLRAMRFRKKREGGLLFLRGQYTGMQLQETVVVRRGEYVNLNWIFSLLFFFDFTLFVGGGGVPVGHSECLI